MSEPVEKRPPFIRTIKIDDANPLITVANTQRVWASTIVRIPSRKTAVVASIGDCKEKCNQRGETGMDTKCVELSAELPLEQAEMVARRQVEKWAGRRDFPDVRVKLETEADIKRTFDDAHLIEIIQDGMLIELQKPEFAQLNHYLRTRRSPNVPLKFCAFRPKG